MAFLVIDEMKVDVSKITIEEQLELCRLMIKSGYVVERQYRIKDKGSDVVRSYVVAGKRSDIDGTCTR
ncbi:MAG TPA: hypothetical protein IAB23_12660 [Candidatus Scybalocola faecavium]|nr:hypothetical protein [Candidatus Scybalocola faecavium]